MVASARRNAPAPNPLREPFMILRRECSVSGFKRLNEMFLPKAGKKPNERQDAEDAKEWNAKKRELRQYHGNENP